MKKKLLIPLAALLALALTFSLWYTRPRSFWEATGMDPPPGHRRLRLCHGGLHHPR